MKAVRLDILTVSAQLISKEVYDLTAFIKMSGQFNKVQYQPDFKTWIADGNFKSFLTGHLANLAEFFISPSVNI